MQHISFRPFPPLLVVLAVALVALPLIACGDTDDDNDDDHTASGIYETDDGVVLDMQFDPDPPEAGDVDLMMDVTLDDEPLEDADIDIEPWMPAHDHGASTDPVVHHEGDGHYRVDDLSFSMSGHWELNIDIDWEDDDSSLVVDLEVQ